MKVGDTLAGRYELRASLGRGGHGEVFTAHDPRSRGQVAVKVFDVQGPGSQDRLNAMAALLKRAAGVTHRAIVLPRIQVALTERPPFVVGELIAGDDLAAVMARGPVPWQRALDIALACAEGLAAVHAATGAAHRALGPGDVRITPDGEVRVLDLGVAELGPRPPRPRPGGVAEYRAPEQLSDQPGGPASDVFALGVLLFEMTTGVHPYVAPTAFKAAHRLLSQRAAPRPSELAPAIALPAQVEASIVRALAHAPADRFKDCAELAGHLALVRRSPGTLPRPRGPAAPTLDEEATQTIPRLAADDDAEATALRLPIMRERPKPAPVSPQSPPPVIAPDSVQSLPRPLAAPDSPQSPRPPLPPEPTLLPLPPLEFTTPSGDDAQLTGQFSRRSVAPGFDSDEERTVALSRPALAERTVAFTDDGSRLSGRERVEKTVPLAPDLARAPVLERTVRLGERHDTTLELPAGPGDTGALEPTLAGGMASSRAPARATTSTAPDTLSLTSGARPVRQDKIRSALIVLNVACLLLVVLGVCVLLLT